MDLYNERMCKWCFDCGDTIPAVSTVKELHPDGTTCAYNLCQGCIEGPLEMAMEEVQNGKPENRFTLEITSLKLDETPIFKRGDRVDVCWSTRPRQSGTVIHCYVSMRTLQVMVNVVLDGLRWPKLYPARIIEKRVPRGVAAD